MIDPKMMPNLGFTTDDELKFRFSIPLFEKILQKPSLNDSRAEGTVTHSQPKLNFFVL